MKGRGCVLDASAVLAWLLAEDGKDQVESALEGSTISAVNLAEVLYRASDEGFAIDGLTQDIEGFGVTVVPFTGEDARAVERIRSVSRRKGLNVSLADAACLATADRLGLPVMGADHEWQRLELDVEIRMIR